LLINFFLLVSLFTVSACRSPHRLTKNRLPYIRVSTNKSKKTYTFRDSHLREIPLFKTFDINFFNKNLIPKKIETKIGTLNGKEIDHEINKLLKDILKRKPIKDFIILKNLDFNPVTRSGLIILKFKKYPLVLKLFLENAKSLSHPYHNGFQVRGLYLMGGCLRHLAGFTRIKNAQEIKIRCQSSSYWSQRVIVPRKWFWLPKKPTWINIIGVNVGGKQEQKISIPKIYGIIADAIEHDSKIRPSDAECLKLSTFLDYIVDPHSVNFVIEKNTNKIAAIDTEHFPTMVGVTQKIKPAPDYISWYTRLAKKYVKDFFMFKDEREKIQTNSKTDYPLI
jgi:hypothetical protein